MNIQLFSDLHIEFGEFEPKIGKADLLVFAGDINVGVKGITWLNSLKTDKPIIYVLGNHEYYKNVYPRLITKAKNEISKANIHLLENDSVSIDGVNFHGCTLWTDFELFGDPRIAGFECQQVLNDFKRIRLSPKFSKLRAIDVSAIHRKSINWLTQSIEASDGPNVVITHHAPSLNSAPDIYKNDIVTSAYASNLEPLIKKLKPNLWFHGHMHNSSDYFVDDCRVICNPRGYSGELNPSFNEELLININ